MTSLNWRTIVPNWKLVIGTAIAGAVVGSLLYTVTLSSVTAVSVIQSGRIGGLEDSQLRISPTLVVDRRSGPQQLVDKLETADFAKKIAEKIGDPSVALGLAGRQYGGDGKLKARQMSDGTLIEIRITLSDRQKALDAAAAAADLAIADDREMLLPIRAQYQAQVDLLTGALTNANSLSGALTKQAVTAAGSDTNLAEAASRSQQQLTDVAKQLNALKLGMLPPMSQDSAMFATAAVTRPVIKNWWVAAFAGAFAGGAVGFGAGLSGAGRRNDAAIG